MIKPNKFYYSCVVRVGTNLLHSKYYPNLSAVAQDLGITYAQATDIYLKLGRINLFNNNFKYQQRVDIKKIDINN